jgi:hypothetical protein
MTTPWARLSSKLLPWAESAVAAPSSVGSLLARLEFLPDVRLSPGMLR